MKELQKTFAYILLVVNVLVLLLVGYWFASDRSLHAEHGETMVIDPSKFDHLTVKEDVYMEFFDLRDGADVFSGKVLVPKGTVVKPSSIYAYRITIRYIAPGAYRRESDHGQISYKYVPETREYLLHAKTEDFVESSELERLFKEGGAKADKERSIAFWGVFNYFLAYAVILFAVLYFYTVVLSAKRWYFLLYALNAVMFFIDFYVVPRLFFLH